MPGPVIAQVSFNTKRTTASITRPANTTAYAAGDVVSADTGDAHFEFTKALQPGKMTGSITTAILHSSANVATKLDAELFLYHTNITDRADNATFIPTDAEQLTLIGVIDFATADWKVGLATAGAGGNAVIQVNKLGLLFQGGQQQGSGNSTTGISIFGQLVARNAYAPVSGEIFTCELLISQD